MPQLKDVIVSVLTVFFILPPLSPALRLSKCCQRNEDYRVGFDTCALRQGNESIKLWPPPVYSVKTKRLVDGANLQHEENYNMANCSEGFVVKTWMNFQLFDDGSLMIATEKWDSDHFCVDHVSSGDFVVRFCVDDLCSGTNCVRKCCPSGMAIDVNTKLCQSTSTPFEVNFRNETGAHVNSSFFVVRDGVVPECGADGFNLLDESHSDIFYNLPNGTLFIASHPVGHQYTNEYCVDHFMDENSTAMLKALTCFEPHPEASHEQNIALSIYPYFLLFSSLFLIATFVVYALLPELRNIHGVTVMCYVAAMTVMYIGLASIQLSTSLPDAACIGLAVLTHFAFLATFTWLNVLSFDIWWTFSPTSSAKQEAVTFWMKTMEGERLDALQSLDCPPDSDLETNRRGRVQQVQPCNWRFIFYSLYAWGIPLLFVLIGQILDNVETSASTIKPHFGTFKCWFHYEDSFLVYLYGPMALLILNNIVFFIMTAVALSQSSINSASRFHTKQKFCTILSLFIFMGVPWMTEIISYAVNVMVKGANLYWLFTDILNILTSVFVFFLFVCKPNVWRLLKINFPSLQSLDPCCPSCMTRTEEEPLHSNAIDNHESNPPQNQTPL